MNQIELGHLIRALPKVELHVHVEGTLEPEMMFDLAKRNSLSLPYPNVEDLRRAYEFRDLQSFLDLYYEGVRVLLQERDFFDLTWAYLERMAGENVRHVEIFFDPQAHTTRGVDFETVISGIHGALERARSGLGLSSRLILCFLRHLSPASAMETLERALPHRDWICAVGLDSSEAGNPPARFREVFDRARSAGFLTVAHAGEEGPPAYIWQALEELGARRIDHGVRCVEDASLVEHLARRRVPLTVCPLSNVKLRVFPSLKAHNLKSLLEHGLCVSIHSDDPAYFGGYLTDNYLATAQALGLSRMEILQLARNAVEACFLPDDGKKAMLSKIDELNTAG